MKPCFEILSVDKAIKKLARIKRGNKRIAICIIDFDNDTTEKVIASYSESCDIIKNGMTIAHNQDKYLSHLEIFSVVQDINNIIPKGTMHDILIGRE